MSYAPRIMLALGGLASAALGPCLVALPYQWDWDKGVVGASPTLVWSFYAINAILGFALVFNGLMGLALAATGAHRTRPGVIALAALSLFWAFVTLLLFVCVMPVPESLPNLRLGLRCVGVGELALHAGALALMTGAALGRPRAPGGA